MKKRPQALLQLAYVAALCTETSINPEPARALKMQSLTSDEVFYSTETFGHCYIYIFYLMGNSDLKFNELKNEIKVICCVPSQQISQPIYKPIIIAYNLRKNFK